MQISPPVILFVLSLVCIPPTTYALAETIVDQVPDKDKALVEQIVSDVKEISRGMYSCKAEATIIRKVFLNDGRHETKEDVTYFGHIAGKNAYYRIDADSGKGEVSHDITTPKRTISGLSKNGVTVLTGMQTWGRVTSPIDSFTKVAFFPVTHLLENPDFVASNVKVTASDDSPKSVKITADLLVKGRTKTFIELEFKQLFKFVLTGSELKSSAMEFSSKLKYNLEGESIFPVLADIAIASPSSKSSRQVLISSFEPGPVALEEFTPEAIGIEIKDRVGPKLYWVWLIAIGVIVLGVSVRALSRRSVN